MQALPLFLSVLCLNLYRQDITHKIDPADVFVWMTMCWVFSFTSLQMGRKEVDYVWGDRGTMWAMKHLICSNKNKQTNGFFFLLLSTKNSKSIHFVNFFWDSESKATPVNTKLWLFLVCVTRLHIFSVSSVSLSWTATRPCGWSKGTTAKKCFCGDRVIILIFRWSSD